MTTGDVVRVANGGDAALMLELPQQIDPHVNDCAAAIASALRGRWQSILRDVVVGYCTVTVYFDPLRIDASWLESEMRSAAIDVPDDAPREGTLIEVPVCYDADLGPDLPAVAAFARCSAAEVVALHAGTRYRVYMIGFVPGFPYLAEVDSRIAAPRRPIPRPLVPAGSVGIAGRQTGIYPAATPGGWNIVGRTSIKPYDPARAHPVLFQPGDTIQFVPVSRAELNEAE